MSKIKQMITELCPDGVPVKKVKDVYTRLKGTPITAGKMKEIATEDGEIRIFAGGKTVINAHEKDIPKANITRVPAVLVQSRGVIDVIYYDKPFTFKNEMWAYTAENDISVKYLYYVLKNNIQKFRETASGMGSLPQISLAVTEEFMLPVPPLEVQREIVHVLDSFTFLTAELTAELTARKKQYEFYRDQLLNFGDVRRGTHNVIWRTLAELGKWSGGKTPSMANASYWEGGTIPWISSKDMKVSTLADTQDHITEKAVDEASMTVFPENSIAIVTRSGILKHTFPVAYVPFKTTINQDIKILVVDKDVLPRYAFHVIQGKGKDILTKTKKQGGTVDSLDFQKVLAYKVPVPPLDVQERLVKVLDNFEAICTDLNIGLPAEIEARQKQYEYYRDLLLTFAEFGSMLVTDRQTELNAIRLIQYVFGVVFVELGDVATVTKLAGFEFTKYVTYSDEGQIIALRGLNVKNGKLDLNDVKYIDKSDLSKLTRSKLCIGDMLFTYVGTIGQVALIEENDRFYLAPNVALVRVEKPFLKPEFMRYYFQTSMFWDFQIKRLLQSSSMKNIPMEKIRKFVLPIPPLEEQEKIVNILDRFDTLCNDLSEGLPAEIEARRKQYEYYRDKLLSFEELQKK